MTIALAPVRDGTLYSESGNLANGAGQYLFAGETNEGNARRALVAFDVASLIPAGSNVTGATLSLSVSRTRADVETVALHRVLADWGEGSSDAPAEEGAGAAATAGDATWAYRFHAVTGWTTPGGDFDPTPTAAALVGAEGTVASWSSPSLVADVQAWVDGTTANFGWILVGNEADLKVAKRFGSRENPTPGNRPQLVVQFVSSGSTTLPPTTTTTTTPPPTVLEPFVDPLPRPAVAQPETGVAGGAASYRIAMRQVEQKLHRDLPPTTVWGFGDGPSGATYPGPTIEALRDAPIAVTWVNDLRDANGALRTDHALPVDTCLHGAEDASPRTVVHLHGGHVPAAADGYPEATLLPGEQTTYTYPNAQLPGTLWYHDHALGITRLNVYMGLAGFYLLRDAGEQALGLPAGENEIPLAIQDRALAPDGSLLYPAAWEEHFFGDTILVNGTVWPYLEVARGKYRFRVLNGSNSRTYRLSLSDGATFQVIGTDGGLLPAPVTVATLTLGSGERADVVVDFAGYVPGATVRLENDAPAPFPGTPGVGVVPDVIEFRVTAATGHTAPLPETLRPLETLEETAASVVREFVLRKGDDPCTGQRWLINDLDWSVITERPELGATEVWSFVNRSGMMHPMHLHLVMFQVLDRQPFAMQAGEIVPTGPRVPPQAEKAGWKDTVQVGPSEIVRVIARFEDYKGRFPYHCHVLEHEDHEMMRQFETVRCGDGEMDPGEACDDNNLADGDGCSATCDVEPTTTTTTTVTTTSASTTTTTLAMEVQLLDGARLLLTDRSDKPRKRRLEVHSNDGVLLDASGVPEQDATLRVVAVGGDGFATTYVLAADHWSTLKQRTPARGLRYRNPAGPVTKVVLASGRTLVVQGKGPDLGHTLGAEPDRVQIELRIGTRQWCLEFGGETRRFDAGRKLLRTDAPTATACPARAIGAPTGRPRSRAKP